MFGKVLYKSSSLLNHLIHYYLSACLVNVYYVSLHDWQIAGILLDNIARGRTRHIWFTISADLIVDARRWGKRILFVFILFL